MRSLDKSILSALHDFKMQNDGKIRTWLHARGVLLYLLHMIKVGELCYLIPKSEG